MIRVGIIATVFEPADRKYHHLEYRDGMTLEELGVRYFGEGIYAPYINGKAQRNLSVPVSDGDFVHLVGCPTGAWGAVIWSIVKLVAAILILGELFKYLFPLPDQSDTDRDPYLGFQNSYRPEGDALPVVYGTVRTAMPCINQSVLGKLFFGGAPLIGNTETLNSLYVVSHGPIDGFGSVRREVTTTSDIGTAGFLGSLAEIQVNGIDARHFTGTYEWRTGTGSQTPIVGSMGQIAYTNPGVTYALNFEIPTGTDQIPSAFEGQVDYDQRIQETETTEYVRQFLSTKCDLAIVQFLFQQGLWTMDSDSGNFGDNTRIVQCQYWVTDASGTAVPDKVTILPAITIENDEPNTVSMDWPFELVNPTTIAGGGGSKGYAQLQSKVSRRLMMDGTGTAGADLDLLHPGAASTIETNTIDSVAYEYSTHDPNLKFSFASWVRAPDWAGGYGGVASGDPPVQWLFHWSREATLGALWHSQSTPKDTNGWAPDPLLDTSNSFGCAACLAVDPLGIFTTSVGSNDPNVVLMIYTWDGMEGNSQVGDMNVANGYMSRFVSDTLGVASSFGDNPGWKHIGFTWDQTTWRADGAAGGGTRGGKATVIAYVNGFPVPMHLDPTNGADYKISLGGFDDYLYGVKPTSGPYAGMIHVPLKFYTGATTTLRVGGWDNISTSGIAQDTSRIDLAEYAFLDTILPPEWFSGQVNSPDSFGNNPTASVSALMADKTLEPHVLLASPLNDTDVVNTDFYKNYALPDATTEATGCLQIEDLASVITTDGPTFYAQTGTAHGAYYILEVFVKSPTEDDSNNQNTCAIDSITTFLTDSYSYPSVAILSTSLQGTDQIAGTNLDLTAVVHGKKVNVWDGQSVESPTFSFVWSSNPAWIALDVLMNPSFGMGGMFAPEGTYDQIHLPSFFEWAAFCDEGVPDAYGTLGFFGMRTGLPEYYSLTLYFGLIDVANASIQVIPSSWAVGKHFSITEILAGEVGSEWVTANDVVGGYKDCSNMMEVTDIQFKGGIEGGFHGWASWAEVTVKRNREAWLEGGPSTGAGPYPDPGIFADQWLLPSIGSAGQFEHRARFNGVLSKKNAEAWDELLGIFMTGRATPMKVGRKVMAVWDRPREPVALVGQGNIKAGTFELSYSDPKAAPNSMEMEILDEDRNWQGQTILVDYTGTQSSTLFEQIHKERLKLTGCTSRSQATREATFRLNKYALTTVTCKFEVGPDSIHLLPGDRIQVAHDVPEYGFSGRLPLAMQILNNWPKAESIFDSWTQQGGNCVISDRALLEEMTHAVQIPPLPDYNDGSVLAYSVPTSTASDQGQILAGLGLDPAYERTPLWAAQYVCTGDGLYPTPDYNGAIPLAPLDRIDELEKKVNFSIYCKQPPAASYPASNVHGAGGGASDSVCLLIYRICSDAGYIKAAHGALFKWNGSGILAFDSYIGDGPTDPPTNGSPYGITEWVTDPPPAAQLLDDWHRIAITYDNKAATGGGSDAVGDYIQARVLFNYDSTEDFADQPTFYDVSQGGRGNQFLYAGDPTNLDLASGGAGTRYWQGAYCNATTPVAGQKIVHEPDIGPPFYEEDKTTGTGTPGDRGYVIFFDQNTTVGTAPLLMSQSVSLVFAAGSSPLVATRANEPICFTGYFKHYYTGEAFRCLINIRKTVAQSGTEEYTGDGIEVTLTWNGAAYAISHATIGSGLTLSATQAPVRLTDAADDTEWVQVDVVMESDADFNDIGFQVGSNSTSGGAASFYGWGFRLHGASGSAMASGAGTGPPASAARVNPYPHQGTRLWGPYYDATHASLVLRPPAFSSGCQIQLDRDVEAKYGVPCELYLRSSFETDANLNTDVCEVLTLAYNELPTVPNETRTLGARTWISFSTPEKMYPRTGDIYSFGDSGSSTEDFVVVEVRTSPETLIRKIECIEYNEAIYDDANFADIVNPDDDDGPGRHGGGNVGGHDYGGNWDVTYDGPGFGAITLRAKAAPYRAFDGYLVPSWKLSWRTTSRVRKMPYKEVRIFSAKIPSKSYQYVATVPAGVTSYRYDDPHAQTGDAYRFYIQPVGFSGTCLPMDRCPSVIAPSSVYGPLAEVPAVSVSTHGFEQMYHATSGNTSRLAAIEGRIGGWIISTPAWIVDPNVGRFVSQALLPVPTDSAGHTQGIIYARSKTLGGAYGKLTTVTGTEEFADILSSRSHIAEDDYKLVAVDINLEVIDYGTVDARLMWNFGVGGGPVSTSLGPIYYTLDDLVATSSRRTIANAIIQGYQVRHETLADLAFTLGDSTGRNWSLEGPMKDDGGNASVEIEWRWASAVNTSAEEWRPFEPGEVYARSVGFRLKFTRKNTGDNVKLSRFTTICNDVPATTEVDGGTF